MRYLIIFMLLVGIFMFGKRSFHCSFMGTGTEGTGAVQTETRNVDGFHGVQSDIPGDVEIRVATSYSVEARAQGNLLPLLKTEVEDGVLHVYFDENVSSSKEITLLVSGPSFDKLSVSGSGKIRVETPLQSEKMDISVSGSGDFTMLQATIGTLECSVSGSGNVEIGGTANSTEAHISGSGEINAKKLAINELKAHVAGSGSIYAHVNQTIEAHVSGSGNVYYTGDPRVDSDVSGSGNVSRENEQ